MNGKDVNNSKHCRTCLVVNGRACPFVLSPVLISPVLVAHSQVGFAHSSGCQRSFQSSEHRNYSPVVLRHCLFLLVVICTGGAEVRVVTLLAPSQGS